MQTVTANGNKSVPVLDVLTMSPAQLQEIIRAAREQEKALKQGQYNEWKPYAVENTFQGKPMLYLRQNDHEYGKPFGFGIRKAKLILALAQSIQQFVSKYDK